MKKLYYTPFLKLKQNEIMALKELHPTIKEMVVPFFDFSPDKKEKNPKRFDETADKSAKQLLTHFGPDKSIYIDTYDVQDQIISGMHSYLYLLQSLNPIHLIPVTGVDRTQEHQQAIIDYMVGKPKIDQVIAFRVVTEDFASYSAIKDEIEDALYSLLNDLFTQIDLIIDCRIVHHLDQSGIDTAVQQITNFIALFTKDYPVRKVIVSGSSIPVTLGEICQTKSYLMLERNEMLIHQAVATSFEEVHPIEYGDYTTVSPEFMQPNLQATLNGASKFIYADGTHQHIWRGEKLQGPPFKGHQFNEHIRAMINLTPTIYRGTAYSWADEKFYNTQHNTSGYTASTIIKPIINAHISYMSQIYSR
ncbi:beta family protein [Thiomicrorhabdus lithotrophica]|uniref:Beta family protein n=1 Tax=Thiomicrorhabdus lithotrophica TaxID=2949997 RepID=A0ABY8C6Y5_9GAMM|nr:hypothetical protein [Thiomicrorhabdus lithotrophica]WEJ61669.1 beta family protein [Thiomicrorhabdus lithotrophica]